MRPTNCHLKNLRDYFQGIADTMSEEKLTSKVFLNPTDAGMARENVLKDFLERHLPRRCGVINGGYIFDLSGSVSQQIDLIVTNDITLQFKQFDKSGQGGKSFNCIEGSICAISVKTALDKPDLFNALSNIASIPPMPDIQSQLNPQINRQSRQSYQDAPFKVIFAFEGSSAETVYAHLREFYELNTSVPLNRRPDLTIVNNRYVIHHNGSEGAVRRNGTRIAPYTFDIVSSPHVGAYSLMHLLVMIQKYANFSSQFLFSFDSYVNNIP